MTLRFTAFLLALPLAPVFAHSQNVPSAGEYALTFRYDRPGLNVPHWQIKMPPHSPAQYTGAPAKGVDPGIIFFAISNAGSAHLGDLLARSHDMQPCETKSKGIANMGLKTLEFVPQGGTESHCTFNYTDNKPLAEAADYLAGIASTLQAGVELERLHRYDRLGLDNSLALLQGDVKEHRAQELNAIRPTLLSLRNDEALMDRVRSRAQVLLDLADASQ